MKKIGITLLVLLVVFVGLGLAKNVIAQISVTKGVKAVTGLGVEMRSMAVGVFKPVLSLDELKILNPEGFSDKVMADFPEIYVSYNLGDFFKGKVHLVQVRVNLMELVVEKNAANAVNIKSLQSLAPKGGQGGNQPPPKVQIDDLNLKIGKVIFKDYVSGKQNVREFNVNIDENFKNITDLKAVANLILMKALSKTTIPSLANVDLSGIKGEISQAVGQQVQGVAASVQEKATETLMQTEGKVQKFFQH